MRRPRMLDLYSGAGGAAMGYHRAGFDVTGVDIEPQPRYPFEHHVGDAIDFLAEHGHEFDAIHASPPCHDHTALKSRSGLDGTGWLLDATRQALAAHPVTVIENTPGAAMRADLSLCGSMFGLRTYRHRLFEITGPLMLISPAHPKHRVRTSTKKRRACWDAGLHVSVTGDVSTYVGSQALGIDWMTGNELSQAIPPVYTELIGTQLLAHLTHPSSPTRPLGDAQPTQPRPSNTRSKGNVVPVAFTEKCCSHCGTLNWDSQTGNYDNDCTARGREGKKCDTSGEVRKWDENNNRVY